MAKARPDILSEIAHTSWVEHNPTIDGFVASNSHDGSEAAVHGRELDAFCQNGFIGSLGLDVCAYIPAEVFMSVSWLF